MRRSWAGQALPVWHYSLTSTPADTVQRDDELSA